MTTKKTKPIDWRIAVAAIGTLGILECFAMHYGINGTMRTIIFTLIAGIAGLSMPQLKLNK